MTVAVADTGLAAHPWWRDLPWFLERRRDAAEVPDADGDGRLDAQAGHGTFVTGLILRSAPEARVRPLRVLDGRGVGDEAGLLRALARLRDEPPQVLNLSMGGHTYDDRPSPCWRPPWPACRAPSRWPARATPPPTGRSGRPRCPG
ncbi:S8/S53 family peptidase [Streptosporangium sandarakinum]|uniref:S8/S53 family peptidase n=1 Tax=Streptosporangium sandarakinum TaxID=1260955 RepID=UPI003D8FB308